MTKKVSRTRTGRVKGADNMKSFIVAFFVFVLMIPAIAQNNFLPVSRKNAKPEPTTHCSGANAHAHQYSDIRVALVEVSQTDGCGFSYIDLENNSVGMDQHFLYSDVFVATRQNETAGGKTAMLTKISRESIKRGERGLAFYCSHCNAILTFRL
jgi:hypothetical protein